MKNIQAPLRGMRTCVAVDCAREPTGERCVVLRAARGRGGVVCRRMTGEEAAETLRSRTLPVVAALLAHESFTCWLQSPFGSLRKACRVVPALLDLQLPFPVEECESHVLDFRRGPHGVEILVAAARHADLQRARERLAALGADPVVLDQEAIALWTQSVREWPCPEELADAPRVLTVLGENRVTVVVGKASRYGNAYSLTEADPVGMMRRLRVEWQADSVQQVLWLFAGPGAREEARVTRLHRALSEQWPGPLHIHHEPEALLARALATRALTAGPLRCNFRSGAFAHPLLMARRRRQSAVSAGISALAALVLLTVNGVVHVWIGRAEDRLNQAVTTLRDNLLGYRLAAKGQHAVEAVRRKAQKDKSDLEPFVRALGASLLGRVDRIVETAEQSQLTLASVRIGNDQVVVEGTASRWDACEALAGSLRSMGYATRLERRDTQPDGQIPFILRGGGARE